MTQQLQIDPTKLNDFMGHAVADMGAAMSTAMVVIGDKLGLYRAMNEMGPVTPEELAEHTGCRERYVREWLNNQAAGGYVTYDPITQHYTLPPEQAFVLADETSPAFIPGAFQLIEAAMKSEPRIADNFRTGRGMEWGEHDPGVHEGTERFFRPNYSGHLLTDWLPALDGVIEKLQAGASVADIGCGYGASTILMAEAFPRSTFTGFDYHAGSIAIAQQRAASRGLGDHLRFRTAGGSDFPGSAYDLITCFDCLHDMADPLGCARHVRDVLAPDGTWMIVEPFANDAPEQNHNPVGRVYYAASTLLCVPCSLAQNGMALGAQAGEKRLSEVIRAAGFTRVRRATETPFNLVLEARP